MAKHEKQITAKLHDFKTRMEELLEFVCLGTLRLGKEELIET